jgi:hypothetical protein
MTILHLILAFLTCNEQVDIDRLAHRDYHTRSQAMYRLSHGNYRAYLLVINAKHINAEQQWRLSELEHQYQFRVRRTMCDALLSGKLPGCADLALCEWFTTDCERFRYLGQRIDAKRCRWCPDSNSQMWIQATPYMHGTIAGDALELIHQCRNNIP